MDRNWTERVTLGSNVSCLKYVLIWMEEIEQLGPSARAISQKNGKLYVQHQDFSTVAMPAVES